MNRCWVNDSSEGKCKGTNQVNWLYQNETKHGAGSVFESTGPLERVFAAMLVCVGSQWYPSFTRNAMSILYPTSVFWLQMFSCTIWVFFCFENEYKLDLSVCACFENVWETSQNLFWFSFENVWETKNNASSLFWHCIEK